MAVPRAVQAAYDRDLPLIQSVAAIASESVRAHAAACGYLFRERIKTVESLAEKLESGRFDDWRLIDDLYACSVVVPNRHHILPVIEYLDATFVRQDLRGRGIAQTPPDVFRFDAPRFIGTIAPQEGLKRLADLERVLFEVQILTALEYAWQVATHDPVFKGGLVDWRRDRLAAQLKASVEEADNLIAAFDEAASFVVASPHAGTERRARVVALCVDGVAAGNIPEHLAPQSWTRLGDNVVSLVTRYAGKHEVDAELDLLLSEVKRYAAEESVPVGGSLFQLFVAAAFRLHGERALRRFVLVDSDELTTVYRIPSVPASMRLE